MFVSDKARLPPFGNILLAYQKQQVRLNFSVYVNVGRDAEPHTFKEVESGGISTYLPYGEDFLSYEWPVLNQKLIVCDHGGMTELQLVRFCIYLLECGARCIYLWSQEHPCKCFNGESK